MLANTSFKFDFWRFATNDHEINFDQSYRNRIYKWRNKIHSNTLKIILETSVSSSFWGFLMHY
jgi:hypothetical protein